MAFIKRAVLRTDSGPASEGEAGGSQPSQQQQQSVLPPWPRPCLFYPFRRRHRVLALGLTIELFWPRTRLCFATAVPWPCCCTTATHLSRLEPCLANVLPRTWGARPCARMFLEPLPCHFTSQHRPMMLRTVSPPLGRCRPAARRSEPKIEL